MNTLFANIVENAEGVFENDNFFLNPVSKIKLKDACECKIFLRIADDKVYIYPFQAHPYTTFILGDRESESTAQQLGRWIYKSSYYSTKFRPLTYSLVRKEISFNPDEVINVYSISDIPDDYYKFSKDGFDNVRILSHLLYRRELNDYIKRFEKK
jgi:hypothetical protein